MSTIFSNKYFSRQIDFMTNLKLNNRKQILGDGRAGGGRRPDKQTRRPHSTLMLLAATPQPLKHHHLHIRREDPPLHLFFWQLTLNQEISVVLSCYPYILNYAQKLIYIRTFKVNILWMTISCIFKWHLWLKAFL